MILFSLKLQSSLCCLPSSHPPSSPQHICFSSNHIGNTTTQKKWRWWEQHRVLPFLYDWIYCDKQACFALAKTCCSGNLETSQYLKNSAPPPPPREALGGLEIWEGGPRQVFAQSRFFFFSFCSHDVCIVFAYLWEMGVTVIKLTGSQFYGVWIMKSYKTWKSKDIFLKISLGKVRSLV